MSVYSDIFYTCLVGTKENVIRMLNAAICNVGTGNVIVDGDDLETINHKIKEADGHYGLRIAFPDLLDEVCMQDEQLLKKKQDFVFPDDEDAFTARCIDIVGVTKNKEGYAVEFHYYMGEWSYYVDWLYWDDVARVYDCQIFTDDDEYRNNSFIGYCGTRVYTAKNGAVVETHIKPELDLEEYNDAFEELIKLYPERYRPLKIRYFQDKINRMQNEITREEARIERDELMKNKGLFIDSSKWEEFAISDKHGAEVVKRTYKWYLTYHCMSHELVWIDAMKPILQLRAEKWEGINDELHECYSSLLKGLYNDVENRSDHGRKVVEMALEKNRYEEKKGIIIPPDVWQDYMTAECSGPAEIEKVHRQTLGSIIYHHLDKETLEKVLQICVERWKGVNEETADCYASLLARLPQDLEDKMVIEEADKDNLPF